MANQKIAKLQTYVSVLTLVVLCMVVSFKSFAAPVHISVVTKRGQEFGAGISVGKGNECYIVAPFHVIEFAQSITVTDQRGRSATATRFQASEGVDAVLLKVENGHTLNCPEDWSDGVAAESVMDDAEFLVSKKVKKGGVQQRRYFPGDITSSTIELVPYRADGSDRLMEGDSGSALYARNKLLGMIVSVDTASGNGVAIKQSQLHGLFGGIVLEQSTKLAIISPVYERSRENPYATAALRNFVDAETSFGLITLSTATISENKKNLRQGKPQVFPENTDYVITTKIIENRGSRESNPNYKKRSSNSSIKKNFLDSIGNKNFRYYYKASVGVEVRIILPKENRIFDHVQKLNYKVALKKNVDERELKAQVPIRAAVDATRAAFLKYGIPTTSRDKKKSKSGLLNLFSGGD